MRTSRTLLTFSPIAAVTLCIASIAWALPTPVIRATGSSDESLGSIEDVSTALVNSSRVDQEPILTFDELPQQEESNAVTKELDGGESDEETNTNAQSGEGANLDSKAQYFGKLYEEFDANFDLKLDEDELQTLLCKRFLLQPKNISRFEELFDQYDTNGDGGLDITEYVRFDTELPFDEFETTTDTGNDTEPVTPSTITGELPAEEEGEERESEQKSVYPTAWLKKGEMPTLKELGTLDKFI